MNINIAGSYEDIDVTADAFEVLADGALIFKVVEQGSIGRSGDQSVVAYLKPSVWNHFYRQEDE